MMASEYYDVKWLVPFFDLLEVIPVERGKPDSASTRAALRALAAGRVLGVFPEGRIENTRELLPFHTGIALLAMRSGAPIYPAHLDGTQRGKEMGPAFAYRNRAILRFGPPLVIPRKTGRSELSAATRQIESAVKNLAGEVRQ